MQTFMERDLLLREVGALNDSVAPFEMEVYLNPANPYEVHHRDKKPNTVRRDVSEKRSYRLNENLAPERSIVVADPAFLTGIVSWLDVGNTKHKRYLGPNYKGNAATWCNIFAYDYACLAGVYLPHYFWIKFPPSQEDIAKRPQDHITELSANGLYEWFEKYGAHFGWRDITPANADYTNAQNIANAGNVVFASIKRPGTGHIAAIVPETSTQKAKRSDTGKVTAPLQSQAGSTTQNHTYSNNKFYTPTGSVVKIWANMLPGSKLNVSPSPGNILNNDFWNSIMKGVNQGTVNTAPSTPKTSSIQNIDKAVKANRYYATQLGWQNYVDKINDLLLPYSGLSNVSLGEEAFADALRKWQKSKGVNPDGILGPQTWLLMKASILVAKPATTVKPVTGGQGGSYIRTLSASQRTNLDFIAQELNKSAVTNPFSKAAMLSIVSKEIEFHLKQEGGYSKTPNERIRKIFGSRFPPGTSDDFINTLKSDDEKFFNYVYGGRNGNKANEGYKYLGRGFNQITFKERYQRVGKLIGIKLEDEPQKLNTLPVATAALIADFVDRFNHAPAKTLAAYNTTGINGFTRLKDAVMAFYHANAGFGRSYTALWGMSYDKTQPMSIIEIARMVEDGRRKALLRSEEFLQFINTV
jgi:predicted chitinase